MPETIEQSSSEVPRRSRTRRWIIVGLIVAIALYLASPYYAFWRFTVALRAHDATELNERVDFLSLRKSIKQQLNAKIGSLRPQNPKRQKTFDTLADAFGSQLIDSLVDAYLTPDGLAALLANPKLAASPDASVAPSAAPLIAPESTALPERHIDWSRVHYAFFTGARDFLVDTNGTKLRFHLQGLHWRLRSAELDLSNVKL
jgi:hypothetical protein